MNQWSEELKTQTRKALENVDVNAFARDPGCFLKNVNGLFGYISLEDATQNMYCIRSLSLESKGEIMNVYTSVKELQDAGWVID